MKFGKTTPVITPTRESLATNLKLHEQQIKILQKEIDVINVHITDSAEVHPGVEKVLQGLATKINELEKSIKEFGKDIVRIDGKAEEALSRITLIETPPVILED